jgi:hypothetical protein
MRWKGAEMSNFDDFMIEQAVKKNQEISSGLDEISRLRQSNAQMLEALEDLLGDRPDVQEGKCVRCGREYADIDYCECPSDDCPAFKARAAIRAAKGEL